MSNSMRHSVTASTDSVLNSPEPPTNPSLRPLPEPPSAAALAQLDPDHPKLAAFQAAVRDALLKRISDAEDREGRRRQNEELISCDNNVTLEGYISL